MKEGANGGVEVEVSKINTPGHRYQELEGDQMVEKETSLVAQASGDIHLRYRTGRRPHGR